MYYKNSDVRLEEMPKPEIGPAELLVKVISSGVCGSDVMEWYRMKKAPLVLGHEIAGDIVEVGSKVKRYKAGERVFVSHHIPCNTCYHCLNDHHCVCDTLRSTNFYPGGFAEYIRIPDINVDRGTFVIPESVSYDEAVFIEPLACVARGQRLIGVRPGQTMLVLGSGISGLLHIALARISGVASIIATDVSEFRLESATCFGADLAVNAKEDVAKEVRKYNNGRLADMVIVCTGAHSAIKQALESVERGGTILFFAPPNPGKIPEIPIAELWKNEITIKTTYAASPRDISNALELIKSHRIDVADMVTHKFPLANTQEGFRLVSEAAKSIKVIIEPQK